MNIVEIIKKAPKDHVYYSPIVGSCHAFHNTWNEKFPITAISFDGENTIVLTEDGFVFNSVPDHECVLFPSRDNRDWAAFERELDGKPEEKNPLFHSESESFDGSVEMVSIPDRPMMAAVICAGLLAGGCKDKGAALINKAANYADMILEYTKEESNDKC